MEYKTILCLAFSLSTCRDKIREKSRQLSWHGANGLNSHPMEVFMRPLLCLVPARSGEDVRDDSDMEQIKSWTVSDELWNKIEPFVPLVNCKMGRYYKRRPVGGRKPLPARQVFEANCICFCATVTNGRLCLDIMGVWVPFINASKIGLWLVFFFQSGKRAWLSTMTWKG